MSQRRYYSQQSIPGASLILVLGLAAGVAHANIRTGLVAYYSLDEGEEDKAYDWSRNGNTGTLRNGVTWIRPAYRYGGVNVDGSANSRIELGTWNPAAGTGQLSLAMWIRWAGGGGAYQGLIGKRDEWPATTMFQFQVRPENGGTFRLETGSHQVVSPRGTLTPFVQIWAHVAATFDGITGRLYLNGEEVMSGDFVLNGAGEAASMGIGCVTGGGAGHSGNGEVFSGDIDEVRIYNRALSRAEVLETMEGDICECAINTDPGNGEIDVQRDTVLHWPSYHALIHDVYLGTVFEDVSTADRADPRDVLLSQDLRGGVFDPPDVFDFGQTYYWRVDRVNHTPDLALEKGPIWSFTVEQASYPIELVLATASSQSTPVMGPENTVNGSGLNDMDQHSVSASDMWLSAPGDQTPWIQYEFDRVHKLHQMQVWNANQAFEPSSGLGVRALSLETSRDGETWIPLQDAVLAQALGLATYMANTIIQLDHVLARYVRLNVNSGYGPMGQYGLSEVRFFSIPIYASDPMPGDREEIENIRMTLRWRPGREAERHEVILSRSKNEVADGSAVIGTTRGTSFEVDGQRIRYGETYYWAINEINDTDASAYLGPVWRFTAPEFVVIDDFEAYDDWCNRIFFAWQDGMGYSDYLGYVTDQFCCEMMPYEGNTTGSVVGYAQAPFAERTITHSGSQSLPFAYDNASPPFYSEAEWLAPGIDLSTGDADVLSLYFRGPPADADQPSNTSEPLYLILNNQMVVHPDPNATQAAHWTEWEIPLSKFDALNLENVTKIYLGVGDRNNPQAGGAGMLYFDDLRVGRKLSPNKPALPVLSVLVGGDTHDFAEVTDEVTVVVESVF